MGVRFLLHFARFVFTAEVAVPLFGVLARVEMYIGRTRRAFIHSRTNCLSSSIKDSRTGGSQM